MALKKSMSLTNNFGDQTQIDCYVRATEVNCSKLHGVVKIALLRDGTERVLENRDILFDVSVAPGAKNIWEQAYDHLKTLPEYAGATDC
jgi:hypothetical protein